jgi:hypothetical protein
MRARPDRDRLAVRTHEEAGEQIPSGDPWVTDAERAAAGRETLAGRFAALLPDNRRRAAAQYEAGGWPDGQDMVRVWRPRDPAELRARLTDPPLAAWSSGDVLHVVWQGQAAEVQLYGGVQPRLWPGSARAWSRGGSAGRPVRRASGTTWRPGRWNPGSGGPPVDGPSA